MAVNVLVLRTAGTNCDVETAFAFEYVGAKVELVHLNRLIENPKLLSNFQILVIPGGFSYGDDISAGKIFAVRLIKELGESLFEFIGQDKLVLGICNGFQVLVKTGLLPDYKTFGLAQQVTLTDNDSGRFEDRWVYLKAYSSKCVFIDKGDIVYLPVAHAEGKFLAKDDDVLRSLKDNDQIVFRYVDEDGNSGPYPINPNGSVDDIAGICDLSGRILGLMPHPERNIHTTHHPHWTRIKETKYQPAGIKIFRKAVGYFK